MANNTPALTPSAVNNYLKTIIEKDKYMSFFKIKGEISNLKYHSNGNMYFSVKDENAQIDCIMFKSYAVKLTDKYTEGDKVEIDGSLYLYTKMGKYNINARSMKRSGIGDLYEQYEKLKKEYEMKGYFDQSKKRELPRFPNSIGVITSQTGAAVQDILTTLKRRYPIAKVVLYPTLVQGTRAKDDVAKNIRLANEQKSCDVLIVGRGGGSIEDLWAFNEPVVVEAIYASQIPIISSVGHETDTTLSDYVADLRVPTPTAAAERATPDRQELLNNLSSLKEQMINGLKRKVEVDKLKLEALTNSQYFLTPLVHHENKMQTIENQFELQKSAIINKLDFSKQQLINQGHLIDSLNPLTILSKGYSVAKHQNTIVRSINDVEVGNKLSIELADGQIMTEIISTKGKNE